MTKSNTISIALLSLLPTLASLQATSLSETYNIYAGKSAASEAAQHLALAADEEVNIARKGYLPRMSMQVMQLAVGQDIEQQGAGVFADGYDDYDNTRYQFELDQPIIDLTLRHKVEAAEASKQVVEATARKQEADQVEYFVNTILNAARFQNLQRSMDRVIERLEKESIAVNRNYNEQLATVEDLENVRAAFSAMQQEKRAFEQQVRLSLFELGLDPAIAENLMLQSNTDINIESFAEAIPVPEVGALQAEIDAYTSRIKAARLKDAPRLSLYGLYEFDDAGGSQFGSERQLNGYEVGLAVRWDVFDRGINRAEARRLEHLKRAREAEIRAIPSIQQRQVDYAEQRVDVTLKILDTLEDQIVSQSSILDATERAYKEGG